MLKRLVLDNSSVEVPDLSLLTGVKEGKGQSNALESLPILPLKRQGCLQDAQLALAIGHRYQTQNVTSSTTLIRWLSNTKYHNEGS